MSRPAGGVGLAVGIAIVGWALLAFLATRSTLWDRDEPRFAQAGVEMVQSGNYLYPTLNGELRPDKPILIYWLMSLAIRLLGPTELACRFFAPLGIALTALVTFFLARRLYNVRTGHLAMVTLFCSPLVVVTGTAATVDAVLLFFVVASIFLLARSLAGPFRRRDVIPLALALGAAMLTKGPVGLAIPVLTFLGVWWFGRRERRVDGRHALLFALASLLAVAMFLSWAIPANRATDGQFAEAGLGRHVIERMFRPLEGHGASSLPGYLAQLPLYVPVVLLTFFPWTLFLPAGLASREDPAGRFLLLGWILPTIVLMSLIATKLPHYILPLYPALSIVAARAVDRALDGPGRSARDRWWRRGVWFVGPVAVLAAAAVVSLPWIVPLAGARLPCLVAGCLLLVGTGVAIRHHVRGRTGRTVGWLAGVVVAEQLIMGFALLPALERDKPVPALARSLAQVGGDVPVVASGFKEPSLQFYLRRGRLEVVPPGSSLLAWSRGKGTAIVVTTRDRLDSMETEFGSLPLTEVAVARGINVANGKWIELIALGRNWPAAGGSR